MKKSALLIMGLVWLVACSKTAANSPQPFTPLPLPTETKSRAITQTSPPTTSPTPRPTLTPVPTTTPTPQPTPLPGPPVQEQPGPLYETVFQIPVSESGILYRGAGVVDMEPVGPNGMVITPQGDFVVGDVYGNRLLRYDADGNRLEDIDLERLGILNISDLIGASEDLYILEISFKVQPERYRVNHLTIDGDLVRQYDLPKGFHFEDGLYGLALGYTPQGEAQPLIELRGESNRYFQVPDTPTDLPIELPGLPVYGRQLRQITTDVDGMAMLGLGDQNFASPITTGGTLSLLAARVDGSLYMQREDLVAWEPAITTDLTIHFVSAAGNPIGVARYPLADWYFHIWRFLTVGPDGNVYGLITRKASVDILRLIFYSELEPILPGAVDPVVIHDTSKP